MRDILLNKMRRVYQEEAKRRNTTDLLNAVKYVHVAIHTFYV